MILRILFNHKRQRYHRLALFAVFVSLALTALLLSSLRAASSDNPLDIVQPQLQLVHSDHDALVIALTVADYQIESVLHQGEVYQRVVIPEMVQTSDAGAPQLPMRSVLLGVPETAELSVEIVDTTYETLSGFRLAPAPALEIQDGAPGLGATGAVVEQWRLDPARYQSDTLQPDQPAQLGEIGYMRFQAVAQLLLYPVQYNAVRSELRIYRQLVVRVSWATSVAVASGGPSEDNPAYEQILSASLFNYSTMVRSRSGMAESALLAGPAFTHCSNDYPNLNLGLRIEVAQDAVYKVTYQNLLDTGWLARQPATDPRTFRLFNQGQEAPIHINSARPDVFASGDSIIFYGRAMTTPYTTTNVYWLYTGPGTRERMEMRDGTPAQPDTPTIAQALVTEHFETNDIYWQEMRGRSADRWFWGTRRSPNTRGMPAIWDEGKFELHYTPVDGMPAAVRVRYQGYTASAHRTEVLLNDQPIGTSDWSGQVAYTQTIANPPQAFITGENLLTVRTLAVTPAPDQILVDWFEVDYYAHLVAQHDELHFSYQASGVQTFNIGGFTDSNIWVWDVTTPTTPMMFTPAVTKQPDGRYQVQFAADVTQRRDFRAVGLQGLATPKAMRLGRTPQTIRHVEHQTVTHDIDLRTPQLDATYIVVTHRDFWEQANRLANFRSQDFPALVIDVNDIYDAFNNGIFAPDAIRSMIAHGLRCWHIKPLYVVLFGDAYQDYQNRLDSTDVSKTRNFVPSALWATEAFGEVSSDHWYAMVNGIDSWADVLLGRLAAEKVQDAEDIVSKIISYETTPPDSTWDRHVLLVADDDEPKFIEMSEQLSQLMPDVYTITRLYLGQLPIEQIHDGIIAAFNRGSILVNYTGHGDHKGWGVDPFPNDDINTVMFNVTDTLVLTNINKLAVVTLSNCLNGFFAGDENLDSLAEELQRRPNGGAIAVWAPTGLGIPTGHEELMTRFYREIFDFENITLGVVAAQAKTKTDRVGDPWRDLVMTYVLLGDPATKIGAYLLPPQLVQTRPAHGDHNLPIDSSVVVTFSKPVMTDTVALTVENHSEYSFVGAWNSTRTVFTFRPTTQLRHNQTYLLKVAAEDKNLQPLSSGIIQNPWQVQITDDDISPTVTLSVVGGDQNNAPAFSSLLLQFNEAVRQNSVRCQLSPAHAPCQLAWSDEQNARFVHAPLTIGQTYHFTVQAAKDRAGNDLAESTNITFTVGALYQLRLPLVAR